MRGPLPPPRFCGKCRKPIGRRHQEYALCPACTAQAMLDAAERTAERKARHNATEH